MKSRLVLAFLLIAGVVLAADTPSEDRAQIDRDVKALQDRLDKLRPAGTPRPAEADLLADAEIYIKGILWALRYETKLEPRDVELIQKALQRGKQRIDALAAGKKSWADKKGKLVRGYRSAVDGSVQPFGLIVPAKYDKEKPIRLDVVLHGSTKPVGLSELRFMARFDEGDEGGTAPEADFIELHPLGRVENCYRWAGETDVFEAIEAVCRSYRIDRDRIVLRGMSMGASGTWHLGLKHPDRFAALGPYCGYVDTHEFSQTPLGNFVKVGPLPPHQEKTLHMLDSIDYAANAGVVPAIACMGEKDVFFQAHVLMSAAMRKEGLQMVNLISPGTGHVIDPVTHKEQMRLIGAFASRGVDHTPRHIRFVTWTLKYSRCHWLQILGLGEHYARAELEADVADDGSIDVKEPKNVTRFAINHPRLWDEKAKLRIGAKEIPLGPRDLRRGIFVYREEKWGALGALEEDVFPRPARKLPGLQGPIDDAFMTPFLCVRGTGKPWNPAVQKWADASLQRFAHEWSRYFRGELSIKDDKDVTDEDRRRCNLILFGDPGSNSWIAKMQERLPITWTKDELRLGDQRYPAADHAPAFICVPSPWDADDHYVVINSGHTFHEKELSSLNYLLFPRHGDWAVIKVPEKLPEVLDDEVVRAGFFDERWRFPSEKEKQP